MTEKEFFVWDREVIMWFLMSFIAIFELSKGDVIKIPFGNSFTSAQCGFTATKIVTDELIEFEM